MRRKMEFKHIMHGINEQLGITRIQDDSKEVFLGLLRDDFENKKEIFIPAKDIPDTIDIEFTDVTDKSIDDGQKLLQA